MISGIFADKGIAGQRRRRKPDYWLPLIAVALLAVGLVVVYAISPGMSAIRGVSEGYYISKQFIAIFLGVMAFVVMSKIDYNLWRKFVKPVVVMALIASVGVFVFGERVNGAYRWVQIGGLSFQAAELIKFALLIWLADLLARQKAAGRLDDFNATLKPIGIGVGLIVLIVAILQSDFGSTAVMLGMIAGMMFIAGVPMKKLFVGLLVITIMSGLLIGTSSYRRDRVATFLNPTADCQNEGYQSCQALIAVGSGGLFGLGLARSVQAYGYLPEAANDSIFAIIAEKFGFFGVSLIVAAFTVLFGRLTRIIERAPDEFSRLVVSGILAWFSVQTIINIGAMIGLLPLKGITLPFISYGGTSLFFVTGALGLAFQISKYCTLGRNTTEEGVVHDNSAYRRRHGRPHYAAVSRR